jgi:hypothetical protein
MILTKHGIWDKTTPSSIRVDQRGEFTRSKTSGRLFRNMTMLSNQPAPTLPRRMVEEYDSIKPSASRYGAFSTPRVSRPVLCPMRIRCGSDADPIHYSTPFTSRIGCGTVPFGAPHTKHTLVRSLTCSTYVLSTPSSPTSRVSGVSGDRPAKLDRHMFHGVFLGYTVSILTVRYYDLPSARIKTARNVVSKTLNTCGLV